MQSGFWHKGNVSNLISFSLLVGGWAATEKGLVAGPWILAVGLFGFAGGITNWLAVKMLFDRVPLLYGSGVIPNRFEEIRAKIKELIMVHFFDEDHLKRNMEEGFGLLPEAHEVEFKLLELLQSDEVDQIIEKKLEEITSSVGAMIKLVGVDLVKSLVKDFLSGMAVELTLRLMEELKKMGPDMAAVRTKVDQLLTAKRKELTPPVVKGMMEDVMRKHLGWLVVWGNVFGGAIGLLSRGLGYR